MSLRQVSFPWLTDVFTTTDATVTSSAACTVIIPSGACGWVEMTVTARNTTSGAGAMIRVVQSFQNISGSLTLAASLVTPVALNGDATFIASLVASTMATFGTSGTSIVPTVKGPVVAANVEWLLDCRYTIH